MNFKSENRKRTSNRMEFWEPKLKVSMSIRIVINIIENQWSAFVRNALNMFTRSVWYTAIVSNLASTVHK